LGEREAAGIFGRLVLEPVESTGPATPGVKAAPEFSAAACMIAIAT